MKLIAALAFTLVLASTNHAQNCSSMNIQHEADIPSFAFQMTMTMRQDNTGLPYLYVANKEGGLRIYDITMLSQPKLMKQIQTSELEDLDVMNLWQDGKYLYLALGNHFTNPEHSGMAIVDVSSPPNAFVTDTWKNAADSGGAGIVKVEGDYAYLGAMKHGLIIFDISNKSDIKFVSQFIPDPNFPSANPDPDLYNARGMEVENGIVYLCFDAGGIRIINTTNKLQPTETGRFSNPELNAMPRAYNNVVLDDTLLYVAVDYCGIEVLSIADTANIKLIGWWNPFDCVGRNWFASPVHANEIEYNAACKQLFTSTGKSDMYVIDVSDPTSPDSCTIYGGVDNQIGTWGVSTHEDRIYLSYIVAIVPFVSDWTGVKILTYTPCTAGLVEAKSPIEAVYPQPAVDKLYLRLEDDLSGNESMSVSAFTMLGEVISLPFVVSGKQEIAVDISKLSVGAYTLRVNDGKTIYTKKCIKERH